MRRLGGRGRLLQCPGRHNLLHLRDDSLELGETGLDRIGGGEVDSRFSQQRKWVVAATGGQESPVALAGRLALIANRAGDRDRRGQSSCVLIDIKCTIKMRNPRPV